jgi:hypothetical protein
MARCTFYVQIEPEWSAYASHNGDPQLRTIKAKRMTQSRPSDPLGGSVMVKMTVEVPDSAFMPLRPEAIVVVPENFVKDNPIEVIVEDANEQAVS